MPAPLPNANPDRRRSFPIKQAVPDQQVIADLSLETPPATPAMRFKPLRRR
jgi:hypothetical protein